jgi:UDP-N-acetylglucosamine 4,6-dehydratase
MKIAITGATGSLGRRLVWACAMQHHCERVVALARSEYALAIHYQFFKENLPPDAFERIHWMMGDIRDRARLEKAFHGCDSVIHAAALKRVDTVLDNPTELKLTNVDALITTLEAAMVAGVQKFIFVSSDKAVQPENCYGASKMFGEELVRSFNVYSYPRGMSCLSVRYGNVMGSRGSVYWNWLREFELPNPCLKVTSVEMTRFYMSFQMAIDTIMAAYHQGLAGQTIIPECPSYRLVDFLEAMFQILSPTSRVDWSVEGLRQGGEKYHESLVSRGQLADGWDTIRRGNSDFVVLPGHNYGDEKDFLLSSHAGDAYAANQLTVPILKCIINEFYNTDRLGHFDCQRGEGRISTASLDESFTEKIGLTD